MITNLHLILYVIAFGSGVIVASIFQIPQSWLFIGLGTLSLFLWFGYHARVLGYRVVLLIVLLLFLLGGLRMNASSIDNPFMDFAGQNVSFQGQVVSDIKNDDGKISFYFRPHEFEEYILVSLQGRTDLRYGQVITISGKVQLPKNTTFDYVSYLAKENVYALMSYAQVIVREQSSWRDPAVTMFAIKAWYDRRVSAILATGEAGLVKGILLGDKADIPDDIIKLFQKTGTGHMVAVSGFNITIIIAMLVHGFRYFGRRLGIIIASSLIWSFVIMTGASASVVRAALMGMLVLVGWWFGRSSTTERALWLSLFFMVLWNPKLLYFDIGFQLSFAATLGLIYISPFIEKITKRFPDPFGLVSAGGTTMAALIATIPFSIVYFRQFSFVAPLSNMLTLPLVPLIMLSGFLMVVPGLSHGAALITHYLIVLMIGLLRLTGSLPYASFSW